MSRGRLRHDNDNSTDSWLTKAVYHGAKGCYVLKHFKISTWTSRRTHDCRTRDDESASAKLF
eukprot:6189795-Pleurochrysis_carterae.AAC.1